MGPVRPAVRGYVGCAVLGALVCVAPGAELGAPWGVILPLAALYAACERIPRRRPGGRPAPERLGPFFPVLLAGAFLLPPPAAALVPLPGALLAPVPRRPQGLRRSWRAAQLALAVAAASRVHAALGGPDAVAAPRFPYALLPTGAAVVAFCLVLTALDSGILALGAGVPPRSAGQPGSGRELPRQAAFAPSRRPARSPGLFGQGAPPPAAPAECPSTSGTRTSGRHTGSTLPHSRLRSSGGTPAPPLLDGRTPPAGALGGAWRKLMLAFLAPVAVQGLAGLMMAVLWRSPYGPVAALLVLLPMYLSCWVFAQYHRERAAHQATIRALVQAVDIKDGYTRGHSERVGQASMMIARELGMEDERVEVLRFAGILHDIGKLGVPTRLLRKDGPLTPEERRIIELHPEYGHEMVRGIGFLGEARSAILHHHERLDGSGYPYGLMGTQIPECARVVAVADAFDAMTSTRSYRRARPVAAALRELERCAGAQFDPAMVRALIRALEHWGFPRSGGSPRSSEAESGREPGAGTEGGSGWYPAVTSDEESPTVPLPALPVPGPLEGQRRGGGGA